MFCTIVVSKTDFTKPPYPLTLFIINFLLLTASPIVTIPLDMLNCIAPTTMLSLKVTCVVPDTVKG